jgi:hypothetical protein
MQMLTVAGKLNWNSWFRGVVGALVSGGASSVASAFGTVILDKQHDLNIFAMMGITFLFSGVISLAKFLQTQPIPQEET